MTARYNHNPVAILKSPMCRIAVLAKTRRFGSELQQRGGPRRRRSSAAAAPYSPLSLRVFNEVSTAWCESSSATSLPLLLFPILHCMNFPPPPPPAPGQLERDAHNAAAENDRAVSSPVIHFVLSCVPYDTSGPPLHPPRTRQHLTVLVHAGRTQQWFWMQVQQHLSRFRDSRPVFPNLFIDPALSQATIDLANRDPHQPKTNPLPTRILSPPPLPPPLPPTSDSRDEWWTVHALHVLQLPPPASPNPLSAPSLPPSDQWCAALLLRGGHAQAFCPERTLADAGVNNDCMLTLAVRQHRGFLPSC